MSASALVELERAELRARERRLAAATEAEQRVAVATAAAARIRDGIAAAIAAAVEARRAEHEAECAAEIAAIESEAAGPLGHPPAPAAGGSSADTRLELAVGRLVAAVLDEPEA
jgi:hypothetical protein